MKFTVSDMPGRGSLRPRDVVELARVADRVGIDRVGVTDSPFRPELIPLMAAVLAATERVEVESLVSTAFRRPPDVTASTWATLAELSGGRAILGLGRGSDENALWIEPWGLGKRPTLAGLRQLILISRQMWAGEAPDVPGPWQVAGRPLEYAVEHPIPILVGGRGPAILRLAAELADIVHLAVPFTGVEYIRRNIAYVHEQAAAAGRAPDELEIDVTIAVAASHDRARARRAAKRAAAGGLGALVESEHPGGEPVALNVDGYAFDRELVAAVVDPPPAAPQEARGDGTGRWARAPLTANVEDLIDDRVADAFVVSGSAPEIEERLRELKEALPGATGFRLKPPPFTGPDAFANAREQIELLGGVVQRLRD